MSLQRKQQRGRKVVVWFAASFLLVQFAGSLLLDYAWPEVRFPMAFRQFRSYRECPRSPDVICLGSSRIESSVHAKEITQTVRHVVGKQDFLAFNAHVPGGDFISAEFVWKELWQQGARPKVILLEMCPEQVNHLNDWLKLHVMRQIRWDDVASYALETCRTGHALRLVQARFMPLYTHRYELVRTTKNSVQAWLMPEEQAPPTPESEEFRDCSQFAAKQLPVPADARRETMSGLHGAERGLRRYRPGGTSVQALERMLKFWQQQDITVVLLGVPLSKAHRDLYTPSIETQFRAYAQRLESTYGCKYVDCRDQVPDFLFKDNHHATGRGGQYFTQRFTREVLIPTLAARVPATKTAANR